MFSWSGFAFMLLVGCLLGAFLYVVVRWGRVDLARQYGPDTVKSYAWKIGCGAAVAMPILYLLMLGRGGK